MSETPPPPPPPPFGSSPFGDSPFGGPSQPSTPPTPPAFPYPPVGQQSPQPPWSQQGAPIFPGNNVPPAPPGGSGWGQAPQPYPGSQYPMGTLPGPRGGLAVAALVLGIVGVVLCFAVIPSVLAIVFGALAMRRTSRAPAQFTGRGKAKAGLILGIVGVLVGAGFWTYAIVKAADKTALSDLKAGDCVKVPTGTIFIGVTKQSCAKPHEGEVFVAQELATPGSYPGDDQVKQTVVDICSGAFEAYVGTAFNDSALTITFVRPSKSIWESTTSTTILCIAKNKDGSLLTNPVKGSNR